ncbi:MAG: hypothetical protein KDD89_10720, partial [Anaerolineales bacterium]|nr:hypothetical protein [Anaerolineales bacterium]
GTTLIIRNSTISGNQSVDDGGGAVFAIDSAIVTIENSTIVNNTAGDAAGGLDMAGPLAATNVQILNSIIADNTNTGAGGDDCNTNSDPITMNHTLLEDTTTCVISGSNNVTGSDPNLSALANNGGETPTHAFASSASPAIDAGQTANGACDGVGANPDITSDQRGITRAQDGDLDGTADCDMGAYEYVPINCGIQAAGEPAVYNFFEDVAINVTNDGTDLDCISVEQVNGNHPNATSSGSADALETGRYWVIEGFQVGGTTPATNDFTYDLTLPYTGADADSRVCEWLEGIGPGFGWDCQYSSHVANTSVTRTGITGFSDWAVGDQVGPTAVSGLQADAASPANSWLLVGLLVGLLASVTAGMATRRIRSR